jgi:Phage portal protein, SPP1 Gp6-like
MSFEPTELLDTGLDGPFLDLLLDEHVHNILPRLERLWDYYRNEESPATWRDNHAETRPYLAQQRGLPRRLNLPPQEARSFGGDTGAPEVVIENDIAWRVHTLVDFMFGKPAELQSLAPDPEQASRVQALLRAVFDANGGIGFYQDLALLGSVYGYVDVLLRVGPELANRSRASGDQVNAWPEDFAHQFVLETIEAPRAVPVLNEDDYRRLDAYVLHYRQALNAVDEGGVLDSLRTWVDGRALPRARRASVERTQVWTDHLVATFEGTPTRRRLVERSVNRLGRLPVVHIQNLPQPFFYEGLSEVEPLIPLQDELNTRLSDRANRVTLQSFKMYLGKGIDKFTERPIGPGQMWATDNPEATIEEFGGDAASPSEEAHINEIREAMDKTSAVTAVAAGLLRNKVGNLTSENALRIVMMGLLAKTEKKRVTYGAGIAQLCELILHAADLFGVLKTEPRDRRIRLNWPNPLPADESQRLRDAKLKLEIGVPAKQVLTELGYADCVAM